MSDIGKMSAVLEMIPMGKQRPRFGGRVFMSQAYLDWKNDFSRLFIGAVLSSGGNIWMIDGRFRLSLTIQTPSGKSRSDLDNIIGAVLDSLQDAVLIANDRNCVEISANLEKSGKRGVYLMSVEVESV